MRKITSMFLITMLLFCVAQAANADSTINKLGQINNKVYTNKFFGFSVAIPKGWTVLGELQQEQESKFARSMMKHKALLRDQHSGKVHLLHVVNPSNRSSVMISFVYPSEATEHLTSDQLLEGLKRSMGALSRVKATFGPNMSDVNIGGAKFARTVISLDFGTVNVKEAFLITKSKGYFLVIATAYTSQAGKVSTEKVLSALKFKE